jgi:lipopolysaccharide transport system permease protein
MLFNQALALTRANLKSRYRNSFSGFIWVVLNPLLMFTAQSYAFHFILKIDVHNYPLFLMTGLLPWLFLSQTLEMSAPSLLWQGQILKSFKLNPLVFILAQVVDNGINFLAAFILALFGLSFLENFEFWHLLFLPIALLPLLLSTLSLAWFMAGAQILLRDLRFVMTFILSISYFLTPIFYPIDLIPEEFKWIVKINPLYYLITPFREMIQSPLSQNFVTSIAIAFAISLVLFLISYFFWRWKKNVIYFNL